MPDYDHAVGWAGGLLVGLAIVASSKSATAGPEITLREFAGAQIKKGVRTIGMGGDGATTGNYALVYRDAGSAIADEGVVRFADTDNLFTFTAVGMTTPTFWDGAAFYVVALRQTGSDIHVWDLTPPSAMKPPSTGDLTDTSVFVKIAKPIVKTLSIGLMGAFELSRATLAPDAGGPPIQFATSYLPSGGLGLHWHPNDHWQLGARVIFNRDQETRSQGSSVTSGVLRSYEYRFGEAYSPWEGTLFDVGLVALDRANYLEHTTTFAVNPTIGAEQALVPRRVWARAGLDETTWTTGVSVAFAPFRIDLAYLYNLAAARTADVFGKRNSSLIGTLAFDYESVFAQKR